MAGWVGQEDHARRNAPSSCTTQGADQLPDLFSLGLDYESTTNGASPQYNGNIAAMQWRTNVNGTCLTRQQYRFTYDYGNRLLTANHFTHNGTSWTNTNNYSESGIAYDLNGNIKSYTRRGLTTAPSTFGVIDQLTYTYGDAARPDRLTNVSDAGNTTKGFKFTSGAPAYTYDLNGNMTQDNHKSLSISYNYLNLPSYISNTGGSDITLTYTADGEKLSKVSSAGTRNYVAGIEYLGTGLDAIYHGEGRCTPNGATAFFYEYTIKDHLGNARVNFRANGAAVTFLQELHYYPFGMLMEGIGAAQVTNNGYKYNGKELNEDLGLNWSDYGARWYDAALGRWWSVDLLTEKFVRWSGYNYGVDNPLRFIDPNGMKAKDIIIQYAKGMTDTEKEQYNQSIIKVLSELTNDNLSIKDGKVSIDKKKEGEKKIGTQLIRTLVEGPIKNGKRVKREVAIVKSADKQKNATTIVDPESGVPIDASNGVGTNSRIAFDPDKLNAKENGYYPADGSEKQVGTPEQVLIHELFHGLNIAVGIRNTKPCTNCVFDINIEEARVQTVTNRVAKENPKVPESANPYKE